MLAALNFMTLILSRLISQMLAIFFLELILKDCIKVQEKKKKVVLCSRPRRKHEIRHLHFHVVVVERRQRNVQKSVMHVQSCFALNL